MKVMASSVETPNNIVRRARVANAAPTIPSSRPPITSTRFSRSNMATSLASVAGQRGGSHAGAHDAASEAGIMGWTRILARALARDRPAADAAVQAAVYGGIVGALRREGAAPDRAAPLREVGRGDPGQA